MASVPDVPNDEESFPCGDQQVVRQHDQIVAVRQIVAVQAAHLEIEESSLVLVQEISVLGAIEKHRLVVPNYDKNVCFLAIIMG